MSSEPKRLLLPLFAPTVKSGWTWERLDSVAEVYDCPHSTPQLVDDKDAPFVVRSQDVRSGSFLLDGVARVSSETYRERIKRVEPRYGDLVYSREGTYFGIAAEVPKGIKVCLGQRMVLIRPDTARINHTFLKYWLNSPQVFGHIHGFRDGTVAERLNLPVIRGLSVAFPSFAEQCVIADTLAALDDRFALLRETNATLEAIAQAMFKSWFVDFDPVHAKQQGRAPEGMSEATAALFPDSFEESELGLVPSGWKVMPFLDACDLLGGSQPPASSFVDEPRDGYVRLLQIRDFSTDAHKTYIPDTSKLKKVSEDDVLIGRYGSASGDKARDSLGRVCRGLSGAYNVALMKLNPIQVGREFALQMVNDPRFYGYLQGVSSKAVQSGFSKTELGMYKVVIPPREITELYESFGVAIWTRVKFGAEMQRLLSELRDTLLPRLISGQLRIPDAEGVAL